MLYIFVKYNCSYPAVSIEPSSVNTVYRIFCMCSRWCHEIKTSKSFALLFIHILCSGFKALFDGKSLL